MQSRRRFLAIIVISGLLLVSFYLLFKEPILLAIGDYLVIQDELKPVDVILVIAGDDYRTDYAIQLYKQGYAKVIFFTGGMCQFHGYYHGEHGMQLALAHGIPQDAIAYDDTPVKSTYDEAELLKKYIEANPPAIQSVMVVSDPQHMRRARWTYRQVLGKEIGIRMAPVPFERLPYKRRWWEDVRSKRYVIGEYQKYIYYIARYQMSWGLLKDWLVSFDKE